jgi:SagB-type dehydrogenase family enzyme
LLFFCFFWQNIFFGIFFYLQIIDYFRLRIDDLRNAFDFKIISSERRSEATSINRQLSIFDLQFFFFGSGLSGLGQRREYMSGYETQKVIKLPEPVLDGAISVEKALAARRSVRNYAALPLTLAELSQLLWAAQGISNPRGLRTTPSAGALYPLEIYSVAGNVDGLASGVYKYDCLNHVLVKTGDSDIRAELFDAALRQGSIKTAPLVMVICAVYQRVTAKYGDRGIRYTDMEAGHAAQNIYLQAESLGLVTVAIGAFHDSKVKKIVNLVKTEQPLYLMPIGNNR